MSNPFFLRKKSTLMTVLTITLIAFSSAPILAQRISPHFEFYREPSGKPTIDPKSRPPPSTQRELEDTLNGFARDAGRLFGDFLRNLNGGPSVDLQGRATISPQPLVPQE